MINLSLSCERSFLFICPRCWDCWARVRGQEPYFSHRFIPCTQHARSCPAYDFDLAGSLIEEDCVPLDALPPDLVAREFSLFMSTQEPP